MIIEALFRKACERAQEEGTEEPKKEGIMIL